MAVTRVPLSRAELERFSFLDDVDRGLVETKRRDHNKLGFSLQLVTASNCRSCGQGSCSAGSAGLTW
ncbi:DUF4158 domain-containing protein [Saccharopolyspora shandongensis]|uniref:DUF4158 domain-containing protein n=1 Tax=Saccharopolyspora shandongensis TaxID=418495 RepID=UPI000B87130E